MEIRALRYVVTLAEELHFGRAARRHFISPQPFGQHVQRVEREVGDRLFERTSRRSRLTPAGARFVEQARAVLAQLDGLRDSPRRKTFRSKTGTLRIGILGFGAGNDGEALREAVRGQPRSDSRAPRAGPGGPVRRGPSVRGGRRRPSTWERWTGWSSRSVLSSPRVAVVPTTSALADATVLTVGELARLPVAERGQPRALAGSGGGRRLDPGAPVVRHPAAIPTAVATTGRVSLHAAAAATSTRVPTSVSSRWRGRRWRSPSPPAAVIDRRRGGRVPSGGRHGPAARDV